ncbi:MAG: KAP family NTPase, partial [Holosporaceae bacterium]|nr:KAP family NTPase [Holosporaceae bacterium]
MAKDYANIYCLSKEDFDNLKKDKKYWEDLPPGAQRFANNILSDIKNKELPYVLSIEGEFGNGKTHFITRFCEHIKDSGIESIYINAFKFDYTDPLLCIIKQMSQIFEEDLSFKEKMPRVLAFLVKVASKRAFGYASNEIEDFYRTFLKT